MAGARARFPNRVSGPIDHNLYYREYKPLLKRVALDDEGFTFHAVRDTFATARFARSHEV
jgi:integrase